MMSPRGGIVVATVPTAMGAAAQPSGPARAPWPSGAAALTAAQWRQDLKELDSQVRALHPDPFVIHPEAEWTTGLSLLGKALPSAAPDRAKIAIIAQVALLDTHSGVFPEEIGIRQYGLALREFADGVYVTGSVDGALNGAQVVSIGSMPIERVLTALRPLINADNASAVHDLRPYFVVQAEILRAIGAVTDIQRPRFALRMPSGAIRTVGLPIVSVDDLFGSISGTGFTPNTPASWRALIAHAVPATVTDRAVVVSFTALDQDANAAIATMRSALRSGRADRVVFDMRYCRGGDYTAADAMREALAEPLVKNRLTVITGSDNVSAGSALAEWLRHNTSARFVGQPPPTITNPMLDEVTFTLPNSGVIVHVPTYQWIFDPADHRRALPLDVDIRDRGADFFRGIDRTLAVALRS